MSVHPSWHFWLSRWLSHPFEKNACQIGSSPQKKSGWKSQKSLTPLLRPFIRPFIGVITAFTTSRGPPCSCYGLGFQKTRAPTFPTAIAGPQGLVLDGPNLPQFHEGSPPPNPDVTKVKNILSQMVVCSNLPWYNLVQSTKSWKNITIKQIQEQKKHGELLCFVEFQFVLFFLRGLDFNKNTWSRVSFGFRCFFSFDLIFVSPFLCFFALLFHLTSLAFLVSSFFCCCFIFKV